MNDASVDPSPCCGRATTIVIDASVVTIPPYAFAYCRSVTSIDFSSAQSLTTIKKHAFEEMSGLLSANMSAAVHLRTIEKDAFKGSHKLTALTLSPNVTSIGGGAFVPSGLYSGLYGGGSLPDFNGANCIEASSGVSQNNPYAPWHSYHPFAQHCPPLLAWDFTDPLRSNRTEISATFGGVNATLKHGARRNIMGAATSGIVAEDQHIDLDISTVAIGGALTIEIVVAWHAFNVGSAAFTCGNGQADQIFLGNKGTTDRLDFWIQRGNGGPRIGSSAAFTLVIGRRYHIAATVRKSTMALYVNGEQVETRSSWPSYPNGVEPDVMTRTTCYIGKTNWPSADKPFAGEVTSLAIYSGAMNRVQVRVRYNELYAYVYTSKTSADTPRTVQEQFACTHQDNKKVACCGSQIVIIIRGDVTSIKPSAFRGCANVLEVDFSGATALESIATSALRQMSSLTAVDLSPAVALQRVNQYAFYHNDRLASVKLSRRTTIIGTDAFNSVLLSSHDTVDFNGVVCAGADVSDTAFRFSCAFQYTYTSQTSCTYTDGAEQCCGAASCIIIASDVVTISDHAFRECINVTAVDFVGAAELQEIGSFAFSGMHQLTALDLAGAPKLTTVGAHAFESASALSHVTLATTITSIGNSAFNPTALQRDSVEWNGVDCVAATAGTTNAFPWGCTTNAPTPAPTAAPSAAPTASPSTASPSFAPTAAPTHRLGAMVDFDQSTSVSEDASTSGATAILSIAIDASAALDDNPATPGEKETVTVVLTHYNATMVEVVASGARTITIGANGPSDTGFEFVGVWDTHQLASRSTSVEFSVSSNFESGAGPAKVVTEITVPVQVLGVAQPSFRLFCTNTSISNLTDLIVAGRCSPSITTNGGDRVVVAGGNCDDCPQPPFGAKTTVVVGNVVVAAEVSPDGEWLAFVTPLIAEHLRNSGGFVFNVYFPLTITSGAGRQGAIAGNVSIGPGAPRSADGEHLACAKPRGLSEHPRGLCPDHTPETTGIMYVERCLSYPNPVGDPRWNSTDASVAALFAYGRPDGPPPHCRPCPRGCRCPGGDRCHVLPGFFLDGEKLPEQRDAAPSQCHPTLSVAKLRCIGYSAERPICAAGREGTRCFECSDGFYKVDGGVCHECEHSDTVVLSVVLMSGVFLVVASISFTLVAAVQTSFGRSFNSGALRSVRFASWVVNALAMQAQVGRTASGGQPRVIRRYYMALKLFELNPRAAQHPRCAGSTGEASTAALIYA